MDKEVEKVLSQSGNDLISKIASMIHNIKENGYQPKHLIISKGLFELLGHASNLRYSHCPDVRKPFTLMGLEMHLTEIEGTLEVY